MFILDEIKSVPNDAQDVEPQQDRLGQIHVPAEGHAGVVSSSDGIGGGDDWAPGLEAGHDASLADGNALLFHSQPYQEYDDKNLRNQITRNVPNLTQCPHGQTLRVILSPILSSLDRTMTAPMSSSVMPDTGKPWWMLRIPSLKSLDWGIRSAETWKNIQINSRGGFQIKKLFLPFGATLEWWCAGSSCTASPPCWWWRVGETDTRDSSQLSPE